MVAGSRADPLRSTVRGDRHALRRKIGRPAGPPLRGAETPQQIRGRLPFFEGQREDAEQPARTGELLRKMNLGGQMAAGPMTYQVDGRQYVAIASGRGIFAFALPE